MRKSHIGFTVAALIAGGLVGSAKAALLFSDNFNRTPDTTLDTAPAPGELGGSLAGTVVMQSQQVLQNIVGGQLQLLNVGYSGTTSVRFNHDYDWSTGAAGAAILAAGGMDISFDWTAPENSSGNWISYSVGITPGHTDNAYEVVSGATDSGILLQDNGGVQSFATGGASGTDLAFNPTSLTHHVDLAYSFTSFADGSPVSVVATVDGNPAVIQTFAWNGNGGVIYMELASANTGSNTPLIDNFAVNTLAVPEPASLGLLAIGATSLLGRRRRD
jgi:PEP-CTERM motif-containing protein